MISFCWHRWEKWSDPVDCTKTTYLYGEVLRREVKGQQRRCKKCGVIQLAEIGSAK